MKLIEIQQILETYVIQANAQSQFSQRNTSLNAVRFVETLVLGWLQKGEASLNELAEMATDLGISITGAAIHERLNGQAVDLLSAVLAQSLQQIGQYPRLDVASLASFTAVHVTDSTQISLPAQLYEAFSGGNGDAKIKLQVTLDYLTGQWVGLEVMAGKTSDQKSELPLTQAIAGSLSIFDLGYFKQERLQAIDEQDAYFVSRYQSQTALYDEMTGQRLDLVKYLKAWEQDTCDRQVFLGGRTKLGVRLIAQRLPAQVADARRRKAKKKAKEQGKTCSAAYLYLLGWDILVTNLPLAEFTPHQIIVFYSDANRVGFSHLEIPVTGESFWEKMAIRTRSMSVVCSFDWNFTLSSLNSRRQMATAT
jgi:hypothetical protein